MSRNICVFILLVTSITLSHSQAASVCVATVSDVMCNTTNDNMSFDLTVTENMMPFTPSGTGSNYIYIEELISGSADRIFSAIESNEITNYSITTNNGSGCLDLSQMQFRGDGMLCSPPVLKAAVPSEVSVTDPCNCTDPMNIPAPPSVPTLFHDVLTFTAPGGSPINCLTNCGVFFQNDGSTLLTWPVNMPATGPLNIDFWRTPGSYSASTFSTLLAM